MGRVPNPKRRKKGVKKKKCCGGFWQGSLCSCPLGCRCVTRNGCTECACA